ncbi:NAD(P)/FAD-dependent oxidoreductase [Deinococcus cellulosilyticus]|uniref:D-amino acid oxidase n=1 Tax=Deinococcus cellulosilyticus (strain DSM 18568 / NBRC 106333 / KACC 11606 / 5516J-15) TaxID=1223518 RepID=A0A511N777_DEIC1|nr:FAD-dependent oxidoreductase [Deinococcus cellulosilyticus]GEM48271.1 D-amino acid oxidase [Deinococcus cellulosilyticus NBRC 106333 = KACC 11606]
MNTDAIVVGGGIVGAACAHRLARAGMKVAVIERSCIGGGATAAGMGHVVVMDDNEPEFALTHYSQMLWDRMDLPADAERVHAGTLWVASDEEEMAGASRKQAGYLQHGMKAELISNSQLRQLEPHLRDGLEGGLLIRNDSVVYPPRVAAYLLESSQVKVMEGEVSEILDQGVRLKGGEVLNAPWIILAAGVPSTKLIPELPIRPRKGHLAITDRMPGLVKHQLVELSYLKSAHGSDRDSVAFNVQPRSTGQVLIGSSRQFDAPDGKVDFDILSRMLRKATTFMPALREVLVTRVWTGFRAATPDSLPLIGPHPARKGLILATGHEGLGITTSLGTAELVFSHISGAGCQIDPRPYLPTREVAHA